MIHLSNVKRDFSFLSRDAGHLVEMREYGMQPYVMYASMYTFLMYVLPVT